MPRSKAQSEPFDPKELFRAGEVRNALNAVIPSQSDKGGEMTEESDQSRSPLRIAGVKTMRSREVVQSVFSWHEDPLELVIEISATEALLKPGIRFNANFQVVDHATNHVMRDIWSMGLWPPSKREIHHPGRWNMTPERWGLALGLYLFRAVLEIEQPQFCCLSPLDRLFRVR